MPPLATIVHPTYAVPCVPPGHDVVAIANEPPGARTVTLVAEVVEPEVLVAVSV